MSQAAPDRASRRRKQPYAWLGVGAVTLGMGAAMVGGTAVAFADTGNDSGSASSASEKAGNDAPSAKSDSPAKRVTRGGSVANSRTAGDSTSTPAHRGRSVVAPKVADDVTVAAVPKPTPEVDPAAAPIPAPEATTAPGNSPSPAAAVTPARVGNAAPVVSPPAKAPAVDATPVAPVATPTADTGSVVTPAPAASTPAPAATDPAPSMESWLPTTPIVPGAKVALAKEQIKQAQSLLTAETWGAGNILAGLGSFGPASALATAQLALSIWGSTIANAQAAVKNTVGNPLVHWIAQANLQNELLWPKISDASLSTAQALMTPLSWVGADVTGAKNMTAAAQQNGKIYAKVSIKMVAGTQPVVSAKIAGGSKTALLLDTGASGLVTTRDKVNTANLSPIVGSGNSCFSGNLCYHYETYIAKVDLGDGAVGAAPVNIVTNNAEYPNSVNQFKDFFAWGADGILGVGANTAGPGPAPIPTAAMPGELSDGLLIYQNANPFGLGGYMILGPNLFPTKVSLPGAPDAYVKVSVNGGPKQDGAAIIDTGGVFGTLNRYFLPGAGTYVPAGTKIDVYAPDGSTFLYSYTTQSEGTPYIDSGLFNTGNAPYAQNPIYLNYGATPYGIGSTDFSIY